MKLAQLLDKKGAHAFSVRADTSVAEAIRTMNQNRIGSVMVLTDAGSLEGILTERDILRVFAEAKGDFEHLAVAECMTRDPMTVSPEQTVDEALALMTAKRFRHLPIMRNDKLLGVLSIGDLVKAKLDETADEAEALRAYLRT